MDIAARTPLLSPVTSAAFVAGMLLATRLPQLPPAWLIIVCTGLGAGAWLRGHATVRIAGAALLGMALLCGQGTWRMSAQLPPSMELREATLSGRVVDLPQHEARRTRFDLRVDDASGQPQALRGKTVRLSWYDPWRAAPGFIGPRRAVHAGQRWRLRVKLRAPRGLRNPGGFDGERQMLIDGIAASGQVRDETSARRLDRARGVVAWREAMSGRIVAGTASPSGRFIAALALGDTRGLTPQDWERLRAAGLTHLIAISGFHVGLVGLGVASLLWPLYGLFPRLSLHCPRRIGMGLAAAAGAFAYLLATGASLPTLRTVVMIVFVALALRLRRHAGVAQSLAVAAILVLALDPLSVLRPGFWLSFGGVAWLAWCLQDMRAGHVRQFVAAQAVATLGLMPLAIAFFGQASLAGPFANLVAVPWWSGVVVPLSLLGTLADALHPGWGVPLWNGSAAAFDLSWPLFVRMAESRLALVWLPESASWALPLALLAVFVLMLPRGMPGRALASVLALPLLWPAGTRPPAGALELVQLDVGQGLAIVVRTQRHVLLYDAGPASRDGFDAGERAVLPALRALGVDRLDAMVLSHADADHAGGRDAVAQGVAVDATLAPPGAPLAATSPCLTGQGWEWDGVRFRFLHPVPGFPYLRNQSSCVLRIESAHGSVLLTGDIDDLVESRLLRLPAAELRAEVVGVPHHGSGGSSSPEFVQATRARLALVSAGYANRFRHPRAAVIERWRQAGAEVPGSIEHGALRVTIDRGGIRWQGERSRQPRFWDAVRRRAREAGLSYRSDSPHSAQESR